MTAVVVGFVLINLPYMSLWAFLFFHEGLRVRLLWYMMYAGVHGAGLAGGMFAIVKRHHTVGVATIAVMVVSMTLNYLVSQLMGLPPSAGQIAAPSNILPFFR